MTLTEFLLARIAEDEEEIGSPFGRDEKAGPNGIGWAEVGAISEVLISGHVRALAECEAKRQIVTIMTDQIRLGREARGWDNWEDMAKQTLCALAAVYADHPDYRQEWKV